MNVAKSLKLCLILLLSAGLAFTVACGGEDPGEQTNQENEDTPDAGDDVMDVDDEDVEEDVDDNGDDHEFELAPPTPTCDDEPAPARCADDPTDFEFGTASLITQFEIADEFCCVDFTGDGDPNNVLPQIIDIAGDVDDVNEGIQDSIDDGELILVLEHDGLLELTPGAEFDINFLIGSEVTEDGVYIDETSFDGGTHPHAQVPDAELIENGADFIVEAGPGSMVLSLDLGALTAGAIELDLDLRISNATIVADVDAAASSISDGIALRNGEIGGVLLVEDLVGALNDFGQTCTCLADDPDTATEGPDAIADVNPDTGAVSCALDDPDWSTCTGDQELCGTLAENCDMLSLIGLALDIDTNNNGIEDAFSVGLRFEADGTVILGVGEPDDEPECTSDAECTDQVCDTDAGECVDCLSSDDCTDEVCDLVQNICVNEDCWSDDDCEGNDVCNSDGFVCVACVNSDDCEGDDVCDPDNNVCTDDECFVDDDCDTDEHCDANVCVAD